MTTDYKQELVNYKEAKKIKEEEEEDEEDVPKHSSKKDTKKWCKGKIGKKHIPICVPYKCAKDNAVSATWKELVCSICGKKLDYYFPIWETDNKPDWVMKWENDNKPD